MELPLEKIIEIGLLVATIGGSYAVTKWRLDRSERDLEKNRDEDSRQFEQVWEQMTKIRDWQAKHQEDSANARLSLQKEIGDLQVASGKTDEKFAAIMNILEEIRKDMGRLKEKKG